MTMTQDSGHDKAVRFVLSQVMKKDFAALPKSDQEPPKKMSNSHSRPKDDKDSQSCAPLVRIQTGLVEPGREAEGSPAEPLRVYVTSSAGPDVFHGRAQFRKTISPSTRVQASRVDNRKDGSCALRR